MIGKIIYKSRNHNWKDNYCISLIAHITGKVNQFADNMHRFISLILQQEFQLFSTDGFFLLRGKCYPCFLNKSQTDPCQTGRRLINKKKQHSIFDGLLPLYTVVVYGTRINSFMENLWTVLWSWIVWGVKIPNDATQFCTEMALYRNKWAKLNILYVLILNCNEWKFIVFQEQK